MVNAGLKVILRRFAINPPFTMSMLLPVAVGRENAHKR
jgi:hypothetical protein